jgi:hypothetical protein
MRDPEIQQHLRDVYGPAEPYDVLPEGTTVGTTFQFVGFAIGYGSEHLLQPDEADKIADLLHAAATKCRAITEAEKQEHTRQKQKESQ